MDDILDRIKDLHRQATVERSHYYTGKVLEDAAAEIEKLRAEVAAFQSAKSLFHRLRAAQMRREQP